MAERIGIFMICALLLFGCWGIYNEVTRDRPNSGYANVRVWGVESDESGNGATIVVQCEINDDEIDCLDANLGHIVMHTTWHGLPPGAIYLPGPNGTLVPNE
jgi:hypothetical protein